MAPFRPHQFPVRLTIVAAILIASAVAWITLNPGQIESPPRAAQNAEPKTVAAQTPFAIPAPITDQVSALPVPLSVPITDPTSAVKRERFAPLSEILQEQRPKLILNLFPDVTATAIVDQTRRLGPDRDVSWGQIAGVPGSEFILAREGNVVAATIFIPPQGQYEIRYAGEGRHAVRQLDSEKLPQCAGDKPPPPGEDGEPTDAPAGDTPGVAEDATVVDVMVVYTGQARSAAGGTAGIHTVIDLAIAQANLSYQNSLINAQLNLVYRGELNYTESGSMATDLDRVTKTADGYMDEVHALRNTYGADLVSLFTSTGDSGVAGIAWVMCTPGASFHRFGFSVVRQQFATAHTFAHEVGHNFGCAHDHDNGGCGASVYSYGHRFTASNGTQYRTVMAYAPGQRISYFSNPNVNYLGTPTGVLGTGADAADNARSINNTVGTVAGFRGAVTTPAPPATPTSLTASAVSSTQINLNWQDNSTNETGFAIERAPAPGGPWTNLTTSAANVTSYSNTGLSGSTTYYYRVAALGGGGRSDNSNLANATTAAVPDTTPPSIPTGVTATTVSTSQINLTWTAATDTGGSGFAGYRVFRGGSLIATVSTTSYASTGLTPATAYCFTVAAYDNAGNTSAASTIACATTATPPPAAPSSLVATAVTTNQIELSWVDNSSSESGFTVERAPTSAGAWSVRATVGANVTSYFDEPVNSGSTYFYRVRAFHGGGASGYSALTSATTPVPPGGPSPSEPGENPGQSPLATWEVQWRGAVRGVEFVTFTEQQTVTGVGILNGRCGYFQLNGTWEYNPAGKVTGTFVRVNQEVACAEASSAPADFVASVDKRGRLNVRGKLGGRKFTGKALRVSEHLDLSGAWLAKLVRARVATTEHYAWQPAAPSALYEVTGEELEGRLLVTSRNRLLGYLIRQELTNSVVGVYSGKAGVRSPTIKLKGRDSAGVKHKISAVPE